VDRTTYRPQRTNQPLGRAWRSPDRFLPDGRATYDGRATEEENWFERTGFAIPTGDTFLPTTDEPVDVRYLEVLAMPNGTHRLYYEARLPDESHELRTTVLTGWSAPVGCRASASAGRSPRS
jgi:hypothetical protein